MSTSSRLYAHGIHVVDQAFVGPLADAAHRSPLPIVATDSLIEGHPVVFANRAFAALTGVARGTVLARPVMEVLGERGDPETVARIKTALEDGQSGWWQIQIRRANDTTSPAAIFLTALCDANDRHIGHSINIVDLTAMQGMPGLHSDISPGIYDHAPGFIAISSGENHRIEYANASYRELVKCDDLIGKTFAEALPELAEQGLVAMLDEVYRTGEPFCVTDLPVAIPDPATGDLKQRWIDVVNQPLKDETGAITGLFCEGYDVTDRHEMNEAIAELALKLIHLSRVHAMGTMASTLAHEINQPLTAISNYLAGIELTGEQLSDPDRMVTALKGIDEAARRALAIVNHLRQLTTHRKPNEEPFNLREAVEECVRLVRSSFRPEIAFDNQIAGDTIMTADRVKIQQVLINLLQNACEAMSQTEYPIVSISAIADELGLTVSVADNGPGVSPEAIATMFSWTETAKDHGMGIGLSICRTIVELYDGRIWLNQSGPEGAEFRFSLPWPQAADPAEPAADAAPHT